MASRSLKANEMETSSTDLDKLKILSDAYASAAMLPGFNDGIFIVSPMIALSYIRSLLSAGKPLTQGDPWAARFTEHVLYRDRPLIACSMLVEPAAYFVVPIPAIEPLSHVVTLPY